MQIWLDKVDPPTKILRMHFVTLHHNHSTNQHPAVQTQQKPRVTEAQHNAEKHYLFFSEFSYKIVCKKRLSKPAISSITDTDVTTKPTRLHSSRMRTAHSLTVFPSMLSKRVPGPWGGVPGLGGCLGWGGWSWGAVFQHALRQTPLWKEFLTHASENITLPQTSFAGGKKTKVQRLDPNSWNFRSIFSLIFVALLNVDIEFDSLWTYLEAMYTYIYLSRFRANIKELLNGIHVFLWTVLLSDINFL